VVQLVILELLYPTGELYSYCFVRAFSKMRTRWDAGVAMGYGLRLGLVGVRLVLAVRIRVRAFYTMPYPIPTRPHFTHTL